ncbi:hypothetical protein RJ640_022245 [Escallonia rubra]|uniref:EF-hand domain-containing protein n=1 Tax=Escallonia rubra TaxID=112253 RepID=A0AA88QAK4_9ASTE|nr:hypothetical protein RJ640_022245 [Escallonia rubra]
MRNEYDDYRRKVFFKYEKRIRTQSPPEKVLEYSASLKSPSGEIFMTPADLMRAVVLVFPPSEANRVREGYLNGESVPGELRCAPSKFFMLFDTNNDGLISFAEEIDQNEFKKVMALMRAQNRQGARHRDGLHVGLEVSGSVENGDLLEYFFGKDAKACLEHGKFVQFLRDLHNEILRLEFAHYDYNSVGTISAKDFALSMVASADMKNINKFLDRIDEVTNEPGLRDIRVTCEEFKNVAELRKRLLPLSMAFFSHGKVNGLLTKQDIQRAAYHVCSISLTDNVVDMIFYVFDGNCDGNLSSDEFLRVLQRREWDISQPREAGLMFGNMVLRLLSWVILALAMSRCHGFLEAERLALLQIKASINHPNGTFMPEWKDGNTSDCCDWSGVECHKATRSIIALYLSEERQYKLGDWCLNASLFCPFESLTKLDLAWNGLVICTDDEGLPSTFQ